MTETEQKDFDERLLATRKVLDSLHATISQKRAEVERLPNSRTKAELTALVDKLEAEWSERDATQRLLESGE